MVILLNYNGRDGLVTFMKSSQCMLYIYALACHIGITAPGILCNSMMVDSRKGFSLCLEVHTLLRQYDVWY